jgi:omega-amidase
VPLTLALAQIAGIWEDPIATLREAERYVRLAADAGAGLLCFPEQFVTGWHPRTPRFSETMGGPITRELGRLAAEYGLPLVGSFVEATTNRPRNTCVVFDQEGNPLASYAKIHLFSPAGEDKDYTPGDTLAIFTLGGVRLGVAICYDLRFAPLFHLYAREGVECILVPAAWPCRRIRQWELLLAARALENQCYVAGVNRTGTTPVENYCGHSLIASPSGDILAQAAEEDALLCGQIDTVRVQNARETLPVLKEYRSDLYSRLSGEQG